MIEVRQQIEKALISASDEDASNWLSQKCLALEHFDENFDVLDIPMAMARRKFGDDKLERPDADLPQNTRLWTLADAARFVLLDEVLKRSKQSRAELIKRSYQLGDEHEREAILKSMIHLDRDGALKELVIDACRTNVLTMLSSIAYDNRYPATYFPEHEFNQMILKSLFLGLDVNCVEGLKDRRNPSLSRMCYDYLRERMAANREVPESIWLTIRIVDICESIESFKAGLNHEDIDQRTNIVLSLVWQKSDEEFSSEIDNILTHHKKIEHSERIRLIIENS